MKKGQSHTFGQGQSGSAIRVKVSPTSGQSKITNILPDGQIKINLHLAGNDENAQLIAFLAELFSIPSENFEIVAGVEKREKLIAIIGINPGQLQNLIK